MQDFVLDRLHCDGDFLVLQGEKLIKGHFFLKHWL